jgi:type II secretory pathway component PulM
MAIWIILICALTYVLSWAWLFSRVSKHSARITEERQIAAYEEAV